MQRRVSLSDLEKTAPAHEVTSHSCQTCVLERGELFLSQTGFAEHDSDCTLFELVHQNTVIFTTTSEKITEVYYAEMT